MATPPRHPRTQIRKTDAVAERKAGRAFVAKAADPRQTGLFDVPLPKWIKPCLPTPVEKPPVGSEWVRYNKTYESLAAIIGFMTWIWLRAQSLARFSDQPRNGDADRPRYNVWARSAARFA